LNFPEHKAISLQNECIEAVMQELEFSKNKPFKHLKMYAPLNTKKKDCKLSSKNDNVVMDYSTCNVQLVMSIVDEIIIKLIGTFDNSGNSSSPEPSHINDDIAERVSNAERIISDFVVSKYDFNVSRSDAICLICYKKVIKFNQNDGLKQHLVAYHYDVYAGIFWKANVSNFGINNNVLSKSLIPICNSYVSQSRITLTDDLIDIELAKCGVEAPQNVEYIYKLYLMETFGFISETERDKLVEEAEKKENQFMVVAKPIDDNACQKRMKVFQDLLRKTTVGIFNWLQINSCLKAAVSKGYINLTGYPSDLDIVIIRGHNTKYCPCNAEFVATLKDVIYQPDCGDEGNFIDNKVTVKCSCKINCKNPRHGIERAPHAVYVAKMCMGTPVFKGDQYHKHCKDCPNFGTCLVDTHQKHCLRCGSHYYSNKIIGYPCPNCEPNLRNIMMLSDEPLKCKNMYDNNLFLQGEENSITQIY